MNGHEKYFALLYEYASGELDAALNREIEEHLSVCQDCHSQLRFIEKIKDGMRDAAYECGHDIPGAVMERIRRNKESKRKLRIKVISTIGTAAAFVVIAAMYIWQGGRFDPDYYYAGEFAGSADLDAAEQARTGSPDSAFLTDSGGAPESDGSEENSVLSADNESAHGAFDLVVPMPENGGISGKTEIGMALSAGMAAGMAEERSAEKSASFGASLWEGDDAAEDPETVNRSVVETRKSVYALGGYLASDLLVRAAETRSVSALAANCGKVEEQDASGGYLLFPGDCYEALLTAFVENGIPVYYGNYVENAEYTIVFIASE